MKKVLIIANMFYASPRISGLAEYLPEFGWQPITLTTPLGEDPDSRFGPPNDFKDRQRVIETYGYNPKEEIGLRAKKKFSLTSRESFGYVRPFVRFLYKRYLEIIRYPDEEKGWRPFAVEVADEFVQKESVDAMLSSSPPVTTHFIAKELKSKHKIPWVADFRDLWTQNHDYQYSSLRKVFERRLEVKTMSTADALVTVSELWAEKLRMLHRTKAYAINNGFDPHEMSNGKADLTSKFTITYTGQIYTKQDPSKILLALKDLISHGVIDPKDVDARFYGPKNRILGKKIEQRQLSAIVRQHGITPRKVCFEKQRESQVLLLFKWEDQRERGWHSGKIFEYLAARRPILATGGASDVITELLNETNAGGDAHTVEDVKKALKKWYTEYKVSGKVSYQGNVEKINNYSYRKMAGKFAEVLNIVT
jgi:glycosyltransferase involved in cell wall biosynthesis